MDTSRNIPVAPIIILALISALIALYVTTLPLSTHAENPRKTITQILSNRNAMASDIRRFHLTSDELKELRKELTATEPDVAITHTQSLTIPITSNGIAVSLANDPSIAQYDWKAFDTQVQHIMDLVQTQTTAVGQLRMLYHWVIDNIAYDRSLPYDKSSSGYYALMNRKATCAGYARLFMYIANKIDIPAIVVTTKEHAWVRVQLNKVWYNIDPTWGADFTKRENEFFLLSDDEIYQTHIYNKDQLYPDLSKYPSPWPYVTGPLRP